LFEKYQDFVTKAAQNYGEGVQTILNTASSKVDLWNQWVQEAKEARKRESKF